MWTHIPVGYGCWVVGDVACIAPKFLTEWRVIPFGIFFIEPKKFGANLMERGSVFIRVVFKGLKLTKLLA